MYTPEPSQNAKLPPFDKYAHYHRSVQSPEVDMEFLDRVYRESRGKRASALVLREDFCGTFANCCAWVQRGTKRIAHGVDLDPEPIDYGKEHYLSQLTPAQRQRVHLHLKDVLGRGLPKADIICAMNFSYFIFKDRDTLKRYLRNCLASLEKGGVMVLDHFGGSKCQEPNEEVTEMGEGTTFDYFWDQDSFDPLTHDAMFYIHFKRKGEKKRTNVFSYDWRMWSLPEIKDLLLEVGFSEVRFYWEGATDDGEGDGDYQIAEKGDDCEAWVAYIAALK